MRGTMARSLMLLGLLTMSFAALGQARYPERPVHLIVGFPAGSAADVAGRLIAPKLSDAFGKPFVVENVAGASGNLATERVVKAEPDGHTLALAANGQIIMNRSLSQLAFDPAKDLVPVTQLAALPNILVVPNGAPFAGFLDLIAAAKAHPGQLTYASGGVGGSPHLAGALLTSVAHIDIRHVPYKGVVAALPDLFAGRVTMMFSPASIVMPAVREGRLRALAVTSMKRSPTVADLPTVAEFGLAGFNVEVWLGLLAPVGTPPTIVRSLHREAAKALELPDVQAKLNVLGMERIGNSPEVFAEIIRSEALIWSKVIRDAGIKAD